MISFIYGSVNLTNTQDGSISVLTQSGVGYLITVGQGLLNSINIGDNISLFVETIVKETAISLYGFKDYETQIWFRSLLKVSGVGAKVAINVIDGISIAELIQAIVNEKPEVLKKIAGLGEKVSHKIIMELQKEPAKNAKLFAMVKASRKVKSFVSQSENVQEIEDSKTDLGFDYNRSFTVSTEVLKTAQSLEEAIMESLKKINS
jgi:Holliday junction DNA helicase RuvA